MSIASRLETSAAAAVRAAGGQTTLARALGIPQSTVATWIRRGTALPAKFVIPVEAAFGISRHELRPDIYPPEEQIPSPRVAAQHPAAQPLASAADSPPSAAGVDGPGVSPDSPSGDPLEGMAA
jgi:DNA-binding transcriptional regulator YdaS (Cro superfamily)